MTLLTLWHKYFPHFAELLTSVGSPWHRHARRERHSGIHSMHVQQLFGCRCSGSCVCFSGFDCHSFAMFNVDVPGQKYAEPNAVLICRRGWPWNLNLPGECECKCECQMPIADHKFINYNHCAGTGFSLSTQSHTPTPGGKMWKWRKMGE